MRIFAGPGELAAAAGNGWAPASSGRSSSPAYTAQTRLLYQEASCER
jgi:hypothetical protein